MILLSLRGAFGRAFCHSPDLLVDVVEDASLLLEYPVLRLFVGAGLVELIVEIGVELFETFPMTGAVAEGIAGDEAEGGGQHHPYRQEVSCGFFDHATFS
jgi:hypothetical protein